MKQFNKIFSIINLLIGAAIILLAYYITSATLCIDCSTWELWKGSVPMIIFGALLIISSPLLWKKADIGKYFAIIVWIVGIVFVAISVFTASVVNK